MRPTALACLARTPLRRKLLPTGLLVRRLSHVPPPIPPTPSPLFHPLAWWKANSLAVKKLFTSYGWFAVATYGGVYVGTLSTIFLLIRTGVWVPAPFDVGAYLNAWSIKKALLGDEPLNLPPALSDFLFAWLLTKTTEPVRLVVTIAAVPWLVRHAPVRLLRLLRVPADMRQPHFSELRLGRRGEGAASPAMLESAPQSGAVARSVALGVGTGFLPTAPLSRVARAAAARAAALVRRSAHSSVRK